MNGQYRDEACRAMQTDFDSLSCDQRQVLEHMTRGTCISRNTNIEFSDKLTFGQRLADTVTAFGGSWTFILIFAFVMILWVGVNSFLLSQQSAFDPYPYIFLNLVLSMMSAAQAPIIMMSQNRQDEKDRIEARHDYEVNLKTELEIRELHRKLDQLMAMQKEESNMLAGILENRSLEVH